MHPSLPNRREALAALAGLAGFASAASATTPWPTREWVVAPAETVGLHAPTLQRLAEQGAAAAMDSLLVVRHGVIAHESYFGAFTREQRHPVNSVTKGIVAALLAIAVDQGRLAGPQSTLLEHFQERTAAHLDERKRQLTLQHLLDMQSGLLWSERLGSEPPYTTRELRRSGDWVQFVLDRPMAQAPGTRFDYNSGNSHLLSAVLARATGLSTAAFAGEHLFAPLGISDVVWASDPQGIAIGGFGLELNTRDMAKVGLLMLRGGQWEGRQVLPAAWVAKVRAPRVPMILSAWLDFRYGDQWWALPEFGAHMAVGYNRQLILFMPDRDLVMVTTGRGHWDFRRVLATLRAAVAA